MADDPKSTTPPATDPPADPPQQSTDDGDTAAWSRLEGMIDKAVDKAWAKHSTASKTGSTKSSGDSGEGQTDPPKKSFLEKLITG